MVLNAVLLALVCLLGWYLRQKWVEEREQERKIRMAAVRPPAVSPPPSLKKVQPIDAPAYSDVAVKNLFSADRNPTPIPDPPPPPPPPPKMPPIPIAHGVMMWDGLPPTAVLSESARAPQKGYHPGDKVGEFTLVSVDNKEIVFEWNGKQINKRLDEIMQKGLIASAEAAASGAAAKTTAPATASDGPGMKGGNLSDPGPAGKLSSSSTGPGTETGGVYTCKPGDTSPPGTIMDGLEKKVNTTPFGVTCRWEHVNK